MGTGDDGHFVNVRVRLERGFAGDGGDVFAARDDKILAPIYKKLKSVTRLWKEGFPVS